MYFFFANDELSVSLPQLPSYSWSLLLFFQCNFHPLSSNSMTVALILKNYFFFWALVHECSCREDTFMQRLTSEETSSVNSIHSRHAMKLSCAVHKIMGGNILSPYISLYDEFLSFFLSDWQIVSDFFSNILGDLY